MIEVTDEMVQQAMVIACRHRPVGAGDGDTYAVTVPTRDSMRRAIAAVAPLIEAQARAEIERLQEDSNIWARRYKGAADTADMLDRVIGDISNELECAQDNDVILQTIHALRADLAQARAAAIEAITEADVERAFDEIMAQYAKSDWDDAKEVVEGLDVWRVLAVFLSGPSANEQGEKA